MTIEEFLEQFGHIARSPEGILRIRRLILDLAVRGRLVRQDPSDEPASALLERIKAEREEFVAEGKIRRAKPLPALADQEIPYDAPRGWRWVRLGEPFEFMNGRAFKPEEWGPEGLRIIRIANITDPHAEANRYDGPVDARHMIDDGDLLLSWSATVRASIWQGGRAALNQHIFRVDALAGAVVNRYGEIALTALIHQLHDRLHGSAMQHITKAKLLPIPFPLPPFDEQRRIVDRVNELTKMCDELDEQGVKASERREATARSAVSAIVESDRADADGAVALLNKHLNLCLAPGDGASEVVVQLRRGIRDLAVRGRLVTQDPNEEPAPVLLERIAAERERLVAEKTIRKSKAVSPVSPDEVPFQVPENWTWSRLSETGYCSTGTTPSSANPEMWSETGTDFIQPAHVGGHWPSRHVERRLSPVGRDAARIFEAGTLLVVCIGGGIGRASIADRELACNQQINTVVPLGGIEAEFLRLVAVSSGFQKQMKRATASTAIAILNKGRFEKLILPLPPLSEQRRIVNQVNRLMSICDELQHQHLCERSLAADLAESAVRSLVARAA
jgi:type I restriction enzyme S subunit